MTARMFSGIVILSLIGAVSGWPCEEAKQAMPTLETFPTMLSALNAIGSRYGVPIGLEYASNDTDRTPVRLHVDSGRIETVLDAFVMQKSEYSWKFDAGVYDIFPKTDRDSLLEVNIKEFVVTDATPRELSAALSDLPEIKEWLLKQKARRNELETGPRWSSSDPRVSLTLRRVSLRTVLNRIALSARRQNWVVVRYGDHSEFIGIYI